MNLFNKRPASMLPRLIAAYRSVGHEPLTGYNSYHFGNWMDAPFTTFVSEGQLVGMAGLALQEIMFLDGLGGLIDPRSILVIGNAHGWSTVALALIFPEARIVALDPDEKGNELTNRIAGLLRLNATAVPGYSPQDVGRIVEAELGGSLDFCLIDAVHDDAHLTADFAGIQPFIAKGAIVAMHDVINWNMVEALKGILAQPGVSGRLLTRPPAGLGIACEGPLSRGGVGCREGPGGAGARGGVGGGVPAGGCAASALAGGRGGRT